MPAEVYIEIDTSAVDNAVAGMIKQIADTPYNFGVELVKWQEEDMRRKYPNLSAPDDQTVETDIWPRSRLSKPNRPGRTAVKAGASPSKPIPNRGIRGAGPVKMASKLTGLGARVAFSTRPILREVLWDSMVERMRGILSDIRWKK